MYTESCIVCVRIHTGSYLVLQITTVSQINHLWTNTSGYIISQKRARIINEGRSTFILKHWTAKISMRYKLP